MQLQQENFTASVLLFRLFQCSVEATCRWLAYRADEVGNLPGRVC